ncbi:MAG: hypothetical protein QM483_09915 [Desulfuromusa sp.]
MDAVIDVGSNTIRMLLGDYQNGRLLSPRYCRNITRLSGDFSEQNGLSEAGMCRSLTALKSYKKIISAQQVSQIRVVGTAALRRARNRQTFIDVVYSETGLTIEVIDGAEEALMSTRGALSVISPIPRAAIVIDIGGGSTELACVIDGYIHFQKSYPLGVVRLCEEYSSETDRQQQIDATCKQFAESLAGLDKFDYQLIGTAGTITTLAAIHLQLEKYDADMINNHEISFSWLKRLQQKLELLSVQEREAVAGMEQGRGDLILPGLQILLALLSLLKLSTLRVSDSGLLEGVMLNLTDS